MLTVSVAVCNPDLNILERFLQSLKNFTPEMTQLLIFDNGSESKEFVTIVNKYFATNLTDHSVKCKITHNNKNIGFGQAHNRHLSTTKTKYFAVLQDDIEFFENWATPMISLLGENPKVAQVGPKSKVFNRIHGEKMGEWEDTDEPEYREGSCFIMSAGLAKKYRLFDEEYQYAFFEDMDLSLRLRKDGYVLKNADIQWEHHRGSTVTKMLTGPIDIPGYYINNEYLFKKRWHSYFMKKRFGKTIVLKREGTTEDVFFVTPVIEALKEKYPDSAIILMTLSPEAVQGCFDIDAYANFGSPVPCDLFIDLDYSYEKDFTSHIVDSFGKVAGVKPKSRTGTLYTENQDIEYVNGLIKDYPEFIALDFEDSIPGKEWQRENYIELCKRIKNDGFNIITVGKTTKQHSSVIDADLTLVNVLSLQQTALVISKSKVFIGNEGLLARFAQTTQVPHIILYGCTLPEYVSDVSLPMFYPVVTPVACKGCRHRYAAGTLVACNRNFTCMPSITVDNVYTVFKEAVSKLRPAEK
jgi:GT2 family glycosyltransferase